MTDFFEIDGAQGEGGGQIVRSSVALSMVTGTPVRISNIRAGRNKPGLKRQHLTAVRAAAEVCCATTSPTEIGTRELEFEPGEIRHGEFSFRVGTAGSSTLVLQTVLPALILAQGNSQVDLEGGTHNQWAPPFDFLQRAYLPLVNQMGPTVSAAISQYGFFPAGGGQFRVQVTPCETLRGFDLLSRGKIVRKSATALLSNLPEHIGSRELKVIARKLELKRDNCQVKNVNAHGPGNVVHVECESEHVTEIFTGFGRAGQRAENVARDVVKSAQRYLKADVAVGSYLADQILLPLGISAWQAKRTGEVTADAVAQSIPHTTAAGGSFTTLPLSQHSETHIEILRALLGIQIDVNKSTDSDLVTVIVRP